MPYPRFQRARNFKFFNRTSGNYSLNSTTWTNLDTNSDLSLEAQSGDVIQVGLAAQYNNEAVAAFLNACTLVSGAPLNFFGSGEPSTTTGDGVMGWFGPNGVTQPIGASPMYLTVAGDIVSGLVTVRLRYRTGSASVRTFNASTTDPFQFWARNLGPAQPH